MSLYEGAKTRVRVDSFLSEEFEAKLGCTNNTVMKNNNKNTVLSPFLFALVVDVITEFTRDGALSVLL